jgi:uncharacterized protein (TIGR03083 family)
MPAATFDRSTTIEAVHAVAGRVVELVTGAPDPGVRVPASPQWTVLDAFAHLVTVARRYTDGARHRGEWVDVVSDLAGLNTRQLAELAPYDVPALTGRLRTELAGQAALIGGFADEQPVYKFHGGGTIAADVALGIELGEFVVHGHDIAGALRRPWPIDPAHVELIMQALTPILPGWLSPRAAGHTGRYEVRLRGQGVHRFAFQDGRLTMNPPGPWRPDAVISAEPVTFLLVVYKRISKWPGMATGRLLAWGRRPWRALTFDALFHQP